MVPPEGNETPSPDASDVQAGRLLNELFDRAARGEVLREDELRGEFPEHASELRDHLQLAGQLRQPQDTIGRLVRGGLLRECSDGAGQFTFGKYRIQDVVGEGGMGIVLRASDPDLDREVAIKILRPEIAPDERARRRFLREAKAAARLNHPNVVAVRHVGDQDGTSFMVMEYVRGSSLAEVIRQHGALDGERVRSYFRQIMNGLGAAHDAGLIHRDLKPSNILIDDATQTAKIADFGLARIIDSQSQLTLPQAVFGTPQYMSPEQARGDATIDLRSDLYSAGVVLYEMLTGRPPFRGESPSALLHQIIHTDPPHPGASAPQSDERLAALALRLMAKRPEDRFASVAEVLHFANCDLPITFPARRRRARHATMAALAIILVAAAMWKAGSLVFRQSSLQENRSTVVPRIEGLYRVKRSMGSGVITIKEVRAQFNVEPVDRPFATFDVDVKMAEVISLDTGEQLIIIGTDPQLDGANLFGFDADGMQRWSATITDSHRWPDCPENRRFHPSSLSLGDVDGQPGDEIIVRVDDIECYMTALVVVEPRTGKLGSTFWHMGHLVRTFVAPNFFAPEKSAIIAYGLANKLDGFDSPVPTDEPERTCWDIVPVITILDPANMNGLGPPRTDRVPWLPQVVPHAYAFLDAPSDIGPAHGCRDPETGARREAQANEAVNFVAEDAYPNRFTDGNLRVHVTMKPPPDAASALSADTVIERTAALLLDRDLNFLETNAHRRSLEVKEWYRSRWKTIVQHGRYVE